MEGWQHKAAFVVQFRPGTDIAAGQFDGRIEHISSSRSVRFRTLDELLEFVAEVLTGLGQDRTRPAYEK